jgi:aspartate kinase
MKVFKFGGASVNSVERVRNLGNILAEYTGQKIVVVISAMGKITNALEKVAEAFYAGRKDEALHLFEQVKQQHLSTAKCLLVKEYLACEKQLNDFFTEVEWLLHDKPVRRYDYYYDQIVCTGELLSTNIVSHYLQEIDISNQWLDVRDIIRTDDNFRDANIDWEFTAASVQRSVLPLFEKFDIILTQGFVGATDENESTTLGREGSDYTAAVFANILDAESQTIWKDVVSVMNADPKKFPDAQPIHELNYSEVIEMAYYGAQVIHPKTIKPLQNKGIPLYVKCFLDPSLPGTIIHNGQLEKLPPIIVLKEKQVMLKMTTRDFSFVGNHHLEHLYDLFDKLSLTPNLTQNGAISCLCVLDDRGDKIEALASDAATFFDVQMIRNLSLLTIRHYDSDILSAMIKETSTLVRQQTPDTIQVVMQT